MGGRLVWKGQVDQSVFLFLCLCHCVLVHLQTAPWWWEHNIFLIAILHKTCFTLQAKEWKGQLSLRGKIYHSKQSSVMERISVALFCEVSSRYFWLFSLYQWHLAFQSLLNPIQPWQKIFPGYSLVANPQGANLDKMKAEFRARERRFKSIFLWGHQAGDSYARPQTPKFLIQWNEWMWR